MITIYNPMYGSQTYNNDCLSEAVKMAYHFQRLAYREGLITYTAIFTERTYYHIGLHTYAYKTAVYSSQDISVRLCNILMRNSCLTLAQLVSFGAGINGGFINPWQVRNLGRKTLNELHQLSRFHVCDITISHDKIYDDRCLLNSIVED